MTLVLERVKKLMTDREVKQRELREIDGKLEVIAKTCETSLNGNGFARKASTKPKAARVARKPKSRDDDVTAVRAALTGEHDGSSARQISAKIGISVMRVKNALSVGGFRHEGHRKKSRWYAV